MNDYLSEIKYQKIGESADSKIKQENWNTAFGLQEVDNLFPSEYMASLATENIKGSMSYDKVEENLNRYYRNISKDKLNIFEKEADEVSLRMVRILNDKAFSFNYLTLKQYHKELFYGVDVGLGGKYIGNFRDYNISKNEPVLNGESVIYADYRMIADTLKYDFDEERSQKYTKMSAETQVERIATFTSRIWQVHPFGEGNTRTTALFIQKYLNSMGFCVNNDLFKDNSLYFRNALVRANYSNIQNGIETEQVYLYLFFDNLINNGDNCLDNNKLYIINDKDNDITRKSNRTV